MINLVGKSLGRYKIDEQLGEGGMATVYKAFDTRLERHVAIKVIRLELSYSPRFQQRFEREAKALAKLAHPNIVHINDYGEHEGITFLVMDYLPGGTLKSVMSSPLPYKQAVRMLLPVAQALEYAQGLNIVHRDVKPSNILLTATGQPQLTDFGLAKILEAEDTLNLTGTGMGIGTPGYMAPEQWLGEVLPQADIYALGVVLYEMVTGRKPYVADTPAAVLLKQNNEPLPRPSSFVAGIPEEVENLLFKALAKEPGNRYTDMNTFLEALESLEQLQEHPEKISLEQHDLDVVQPISVSDESITRAEPEPKTARSGFRRGLKTALTYVLIVICILGVFVCMLSIPGIINPEEDGSTPVVGDGVTATITPTSAPTATLQPPPAFEAIIQESFDDPRYDGSHNQEMWDSYQNAASEGVQQDGSWSVIVSVDEEAQNNGVALVTREDWTVADVDYFEVRMMVESYAGTGGAFAIFGLAPEAGQSGEWDIFCMLSPAGPSLYCAVRSDSSDPDYEIADTQIEVHTWYTIQIAIDPHTFEIQFYKDDEMIGSAVPNHVDRWKTAPLRIQLAGLGINNSETFYVHFDNLIMGVQQ
jgi:serine/threonine protein kinase